MVYQPIPRYFPYMQAPYSRIQPFTYRDGRTFIEVLEGVVHYVREFLVPAVDERLEGMHNTFTDALAQLEQAVTDAKTEADRAQSISDQMQEILGPIIIIRDEILNIQDTINQQQTDITDAIAAGTDELNAIKTATISGVNGLLNDYDDQVAAAFASQQAIIDGMIDNAATGFASLVDEMEGIRDQVAGDLVASQDILNSIGDIANGITSDGMLYALLSDPETTSGAFLQTLEEPNGTGGVWRADKFGLIGDGSDESVKLKEFFALGGVLEFEPGKTYGFTITADLVIPDHTTVNTYGSTFNLIGTMDHPTIPLPYMVLVGDYCTIDELNVVVPGGETHSAEVRVMGHHITIGKISVIANAPVDAREIRDHPVFCYSSNNLDIGEIYVRNFWRGIQIGSCSDVRIGHVDVEGHAQALLINGAHRVTVNSGRADNVSPTATGGPAENTVLLTNVTDASILNFSSMQSSEHGFRLGGQGLSNNVLFENCIARKPGVVQGASGACGFKALGYTGLPAEQKHYNVRFINCSVYDARYVTNNDEALHIGKCELVTVSDFTVGHMDNSSSCNHGIYVYGSTNLTFNNILIDNPVGYGVYLRGLDGDGSTNWGGSVTRVAMNNVLVRDANAMFRIASQATGAIVSAATITNALSDNNGNVVTNENGERNTALYMQGLVLGGSGMHGLSSRWVIDMVMQTLTLPDNARPGSTVRSLVSGTSQIVNSSGAWSDF